MRIAPRVSGDPGAKLAVASTGHLGTDWTRSSYVESDKGRKFSCSFVEFDERGDFLDFAQHQHCWTTIRHLCKRERVLLVMYVHGWKNNSQSGDVVEFNDFLGRLAATERVKNANLRVHGVYLSWKGGIFRGGPNEEKTKKLSDPYFSSRIVDSSQRNPVSALTFVPDQLSYWNRKRAAEDRVSAVPISRAIFTYASVARKNPKPGRKKHIVTLMGHSFGALMVEQSVAEASVGAVVTQWPWFSGEKKKSLPHVLPFDLVLLVNSAAPSLYTKMLRDLADAHGSATDHKRPLFVSLTSKGDTATKNLHRIANAGAPLDPSMWKRGYRKQIFEEDADPPVRQSEFYKRTPGHNKFLISHTITADRASSGLRTTRSWNSVFAENLAPKRNPLQFLTSSEPDRKGTSKLTQWTIARKSAIPHGGRNYQPLDSAYWVMVCEKDLIDSHNDVWNPEAMQAYAAIFRFSGALER